MSSELHVFRKSLDLVIMQKLPFIKELPGVEVGESASVMESAWRDFSPKSTQGVAVVIIPTVQCLQFPAPFWSPQGDLEEND